MVLVLRGGSFCPKDRPQAELLVKQVSYCRLVTISTESLSETNEYRDGGGRTLDVLVGCRANLSEGPSISRNTRTQPTIR